MPRLAINYQKTVIYKIVCNDLSVTYTYVGMTTDFTKRKNAHKTNCKITTKGYNYKIYEIIRENGGWINWTMLEIEAYPCMNNAEARLKEREWYDKLHSTMNTIRPSVTEEETKEEKQANQKAYDVMNKEKIKATNKEWYENNKEAHKNSVKIYTEINKEKISASKKEWYELNKEKIRAYQKQYRLNNKVLV